MPRTVTPEDRRSFKMVGSHFLDSTCESAQIPYSNVLRRVVYNWKHLITREKRKRARLRTHLYNMCTRSMFSLRSRTWRLWVHSTQTNLRRTRQSQSLDPSSMKAALKAFVAWKMTEEIGYQEKMLQNNPASPSDSLESLCQTCPSDPAALVPMEDAVECLDRLLHRILHTALRRIPHHTVPGGAQRAADSKRSLHAVPTTEFSTRSTAHAVPDPSPAALIPFPAQSPLQDAAASGVPTQLLLRWATRGRRRRSRPRRTRACWSAGRGSCASGCRPAVRRRGRSCRGFACAARCVGPHARPACRRQVSAAESFKPRRGAAAAGAPGPGIGCSGLADMPACTAPRAGQGVACGTVRGGGSGKWSLCLCGERRSERAR